MGRFTRASEVLVGPRDGAPVLLDQELTRLDASKAETTHAHAGYQPWGVVTVVASAYVGAVDISQASAVEVLLDANLSNFAMTGWVSGRPHEVTVTVRDSGAGGKTFSFAAGITWFAAGGASGVAPVMSDDAGATMVTVVSSADGGTTKAGAYLGLVRHESWTFYPLDVDITVTTAAQAPCLRMQRDGRLLSMRVDVNVQGAGTALLVDLLRSTDGGGTYVTVWTNQANRLSLPVASYGAVATSFDVPTFQAGYKFVPVIDAIPSGTKQRGVVVDLEFLEA